ncbi:MAG: PP2C family protein-serine/threonine phosphatase [Pyrinomonadaceae bacterium]
MSDQMSLHRLIVPLLLAALGYAALLLLAQRFDSSAKWAYQLDRAAATARAREAAARFYGIDAAGWEAWFDAEHREQSDFYLQRVGVPKKSPFVTPVGTTVLLVESSGERRRVRVELNASGQPIGFAFRTYAPPTPSPETPAAAPEETRQAAEDALARLAGAEAGNFRLVSETPQKSGETRFIWESAAPVAEGLKLTAEGVARGRMLTEMSIRTTFAPRVSEEFRAGRDRVTVVNVLNIASVALVVLAAFVSFALSLMRREIFYWQALALLGAAFLLFLAHRFFGGGYEAELLSDVFLSEAGKEFQLNASAAVELMVPSFFFGLALAVLWAAGLALARRSTPAAYASFAALLRGRFLSSSVAARLGVGLLFGGLLAAVPYVVAASRLFGGRVVIEEISPQNFVTTAPALSALFQFLPFPLFTIYGFVVPLFGQLRSGGWRVARIAGLVVGSLWLGEVALSQPSSVAALFTGFLLAVTADQIYHRYDFLTLVAAGFAADVALDAAGLFIQSPETVRRGGLLAFAGLGAFFLLSLVIARWGRRTQEDDELAIAPAVLNAAGQRAERERLIAEFGVAHNAQQRMLPAVPPTIPGYAISAACRPAREVGGDLYDFLALPDERVGIVVADVSGKGVPASLYMTLTKGLLASVAERESDPAAILREVNPHLHEVCRRKVFVTLILGVLDPATRTLTYARAGHNPAIWASSSDRTLKLLSAPGLGLGLVGGKMFDRTLRPEELKLGSGDTVVFYSDGIPEAMNAAGEEFGVERLLAVVERGDGMGANEMRDAILQEVDAFVGDTPPHDDVTVVVIRVGES